MIRISATNAEHAQACLLMESSLYRLSSTVYFAAMYIASGSPFVRYSVSTKRTQYDATSSQGTFCGWRMCSSRITRGVHS